MHSWQPVWRGLTRAERSSYLARHPAPELWAAWLALIDAAWPAPGDADPT